ncbi:TldD/PmbA family protein [Candidatus Phytoplasma meliae]|uniref:TldD/PmbA family protein n=1 Tax=Candidatus Phytoplasma meliae TaxID=1848402 RepID=A0ABS5CYJ7_9MOLU|nr:metallopeptidase TldD-related protein [Candidatus Phytoplasma meliae]MBP5836050.1 TldD/PmbA family protein [Candidatus Phytoplasma meliae]
MTTINNLKVNYQKWISRGLEQHLEALEILVKENKTFKLSSDKGKIDACVHSDVTSITVRAIFEGKKTSLTFEKIDDATFDDVVAKLKENCQTITATEPAIIFEGSPSYPEVIENNFDFNQIPLAKKEQLLFTLSQELAKSPYFKNTDDLIYREFYDQTLLLNSKGLHLSYQNSCAYIYAAAIFQKDQEIENCSKLTLVKEFNSFNPTLQAHQINKMAEKKLGGQSLISQKCPVVFSNEMFADILESFSGIFTGSSAYRNLTKLKDKVNHLIASPKVNIIDDPLHKDAYFKEKFDTEGVACQTKTIIAEGVFKGFIHNLKTAAIFKQNPTGNSFNGDISMVNCYLVPGAQTLNQMIKPIKEGVYITDLIGMHAGIKTVSGDFNLQASGFKIEQGKITTPVKMIVVSGNFFDLLKDIQAIANDFEFQISGFGSASVYINHLSIGGK